MSHILNLHDERKDYQNPALLDSGLLSDPFLQFAEWYKQAENAEVPSVNAMSLATVDADGIPSVRVVLLKEVLEDRLVFFSNYLSKKGRDITQNPWVCVNFFWEKQMRQVKFVGKVAPISRIESEEYFASRPHGSQISAVVSKQSQAAPERAEIDRLAAECSKNFPDKVPCPEHWGGYALEAVEIEFWQGRPDRLHDRFVYTPQKDDPKSWSLQRLWA